jgi:hypothetical protein
VASAIILLTIFEICQKSRSRGARSGVLQQEVKPAFLELLTNPGYGGQNIQTTANRQIKVKP